LPQILRRDSIDRLGIGPGTWATASDEETHMLRESTSPAVFAFTRSGGARIKAQVDIWLATTDGWVHQGDAKFDQVTGTSETHQLALNPGSYTARFRCFVEEAIGGSFGFTFAVSGTPTYQDSGDVNTTPRNDDSRSYDDLFMLVVT